MTCIFFLLLPPPCSAYCKTFFILYFLTVLLLQSNNFFKFVEREEIKWSVLLYNAEVNIWCMFSHFFLDPPNFQGWVEFRTKMPLHRKLSSVLRDHTWQCWGTGVSHRQGKTLTPSLSCGPFKTFLNVFLFWFGGTLCWTLGDYKLCVDCYHLVILGN